MTRLSAWLNAFRLRTLPLAISGILLGSMLAYADGYFRLPVLFLAISTAVLLQIISNLANDYGDAVKGADNKDRVGPKRAIQSGAISKIAMKRGIIITSGLTFIVGLRLLYVAFYPINLLYLLVFLAIGILSIAAAIKYTMGKNPYGYRALGDAFVFIFFGWIAVLGVYFLYSSQLDPIIFLPASSIGFLSVAVLNLNNMRDAIQDEKVGKITLPVKLGVQNSHRYHLFLLSMAFVTASIFAVLKYQISPALSFLILLPLIFIHLKKVFSVSPIELNPELKKIALLTLAFSILLGLGSIFG
ncbi:MAG: 1,4-dihydroxy-2-naphthoate octaprenyltransferase [Patiriisocius sp.]|jgi:1,4-dihydroxy-2-naphthoate octaprenyltransferase